MLVDSVIGEPHEVYFLSYGEYMEKDEVSSIIHTCMTNNMVTSSAGCPH